MNKDQIKLVVLVAVVVLAAYSSSWKIDWTWLALGLLLGTYVDRL